MRRWKMDRDLLERTKKMDFYYSGRHLPYNPRLVERAKELRKNMTSLEKRLWFNFLRELPVRVLRQRPIDNFIVDFYCPEAALVIEIDGDSHYTELAKGQDEERTIILECYGLQGIQIYEFIGGEKF